MNPAECEELPTALQLYGQLPNLYKIGDSKGILNLLQSCIGKDRLDILRFFSRRTGVYIVHISHFLFFNAISLLFPDGRCGAERSRKIFGFLTPKRFFKAFATFFKQISSLVPCPFKFSFSQIFIFNFFPQQLSPLPPLHHIILQFIYPCFCISKYLMKVAHIISY